LYAPIFDRQEALMYARLATFESDPANLDEAIAMVRGEVESDQTPPGLEGAKMLMLVNRETGKGIGVTLFESQEAMRRGDEALNAMNPGAGEQRTSVEFFEVPVQTVSLVGSR
jgi:heme-degrading monooxygenase HmoA